MESKKPLVVVLSRNYSTGLGVIRSLGAAGYTVDLVASTKKKGSSVIAASSKYVRRTVEVNTPKIHEDSGQDLIAALMEYTKNNSEKMVLFPTDDFTATIADANRELLEEHFFMPGIIDGKNGSLAAVMSKTVQGMLAKKAGIMTPLEWEISLRNDIEIPDDMVYPCFVKPLQSVLGHKTEMSVCRTRAELSGCLLEMKAFHRDRSVLVQEFLDIDMEIDLSGVCLDQEIIIPAIIEKTGIAQYERGVTMAGRMASVSKLGNLETRIIDMLRKFRYMGMFDMELNICGDKIYFNEVNFRSGGPNFAYYLNGVNLPAIFVKEITGEGHDPDEEVMPVFGKTFVYEKVAWEDFIHSYMTKQELDECIRNADYTLLTNKEDPGPGKQFYKRIRLSAVKNKMKYALKGGNIKAKNPAAAYKCDIQKRVVVAGRNYGNILTMARGLGKAGYCVDVLRIYKKKPSRLNLLNKLQPDACSKYVSSFRKCVANDKPERVISSLISLAEGDCRPVLMPVDDYTACVVDDFLLQLKEYYHVPCINDKPGEISRLMDKHQQKVLASEFDLPLLHSCLIRSEGGRFKIPDDVCYPCFIKPNVSMKSNKGRMMKCTDRAHLQRVLETYAKSEDFEILVEEYADIKAEYSILGVSTPEKTIAPCMFRVTEGGNKERKGVAITGKVVSCRPYEKIIEESIRYIDSLNYTGLFDIDLIETHDGKIYFIELNFRAGASTHAFTEAGINLPVMLADYFTEGKPVYEVNAEKAEGKSFISEKVLIEEFARSDASIRKVNRNMKDADIYFVKDEEDPQPYRHFKKFYIIAGAMRIPYKLREFKRKH